VHLVEVHRENLALKEEIDRLRMQLAVKTERAASAARMEELLDFVPPRGWSGSGARIVAHRYGPLGVLESVIVDKGKLQGINSNMPVITPDGVVGRTFKVGLNFSTVLLLSDPNSRIPVVSTRTRVPGIAVGQGYGKPLAVYYVHLNALLAEDEYLVTSGTAGIYPKGLPVARVSRIERSEIHLFQLVEAEMLCRVMSREEVLILNNKTELKPDYLGFENIIPDLPPVQKYPEAQ